MIFKKRLKTKKIKIHGPKSYLNKVYYAFKEIFMNLMYNACR